ncbi:MAG: hypothetical protein ACREFY_12495 [Acetobacteraceae bacterium]
MTSEPIQDRAARVADRAEAAGEALASDAAKRVRDVAGNAEPAAEHAYNQAREQVRGAAATLASSMEKQPLGTLVVAGLICGALGFLLARR